MRILTVILPLTGLLATAARADDKTNCWAERSAGSLAACNRMIASGKYRGRQLATVYHRRAVIWRAVNEDNDKAIADDSEAIRLDPRFVVAISSRSLSLWQKGDFTRALADANSAIALDPKDAKSYNRRGLALRSTGDKNGAIKDFDQAIKLEPDNPLFYNNRGNALRDAGYIAKAQADFTKSIALDPNSTTPYGNRGAIFRYNGQFDQALADLDKALKLNPKNGAALVNRALTYQMIGQGEKAQADFKAALDTRQTNVADAKWVRETASQKLASLEKMQSAPVAEPAQSSAPVVANAAGRRVALVIGNSAYKDVPVLTNPRRDATAVAEALKQTGFQTVTLQTDLARDDLINALRLFAQVAESADWAVIYYAGHGLEVAGTNYLVPVDAKIRSDRDVSLEAVSLDQVLNVAERAKKLRLVILDACRDNPFANQMKRTLTVASRSVSRGLAAVEPEAGTMVIYAAKDGETALDGDGSNSPFATALVKNMQTPGLEVRRLFDFVRDDVMESTKRKQKPFSYGSISGRQDFYFVAAK